MSQSYQLSIQKKRIEYYERLRHGDEKRQVNASPQAESHQQCKKTPAEDPTWAL